MTIRLITAFCTAALVVTGCGPSGRVQEETIEIKADPLKQARNLLEGYAKGQPLGSEVTSYDYTVAEVRKVDQKRADILEKGLAELKQTKGPATATKARELLAKIAPMTQGN